MRGAGSGAGASAADSIFGATLAAVRAHLGWIDAHFAEQVRFLQERVRVRTDTPPGNNAPHAERTAELLQAFGFEAEKHRA